MCQFFSLRSDGAGKPYYFDAVIRKKIISGELDYETDSHSSIADYYGFKGKDEDMLNAYEYNPLTKKFVVDRMPNKDDSVIIKEFCFNLDFKTVVPELQVKEIVNPRDIQHGDSVNDTEITLLEMWDSVWDSVRASVRAYISDFFAISNWKYVEHESGKNPFQPCIDLWYLGLVPSFYGKTWRLHKMCDNAKVIYSKQIS